MWSLAVTVLLSIQGSVWSAYPFDFSERECRDLFPERIGKDSLNVGNAHSEEIFTIEPSETIHGFNFGSTQVLIKANSKWRIQGIIMQARVIGNCKDPQQKHPVGHFEVPENHQFLRAANCSGDQFKTVTHKKYPINTDSIVINWFPPENFKAEVYFVATIVSGKNEFWTGIVSHTIRHKDKPVTPGHPQCPMRSKYRTSATSRPSPQGSTGRILHPNNLLICTLLTAILWTVYHN
ncbi:putative defense protein Hdd11 [Saccostrea cucullata]|uniref:putative defense protein Hdd11 n=1 Tax=Saccostrea cuccullata TaxID=36930 RepID=UPI002ED4B20C